MKHLKEILPTWLRFDQPALHVITLGLLLFLLSWQMLSTQMFLTTDTNLRFIQILQLIEHNWQTLAIDYPLREFDPELRHVPYYYAYSVLDGEIFFQISPFFPIMASYFYNWLGAAGLAIVPVAGSLLTAVFIYKLARLARLPHPILILWATVVATPLLFYSVVLWDHTLGTVFAVGAVYTAVVGLHTKPHNLYYLALAGLLLGLGLGQRPEIYMFTVAFGLALLMVTQVPKSILAVVLGGLGGALPVWLAQWLWVGHPFGMAFAPHLLGYGVHPFVATSESVGGEFIRVWFLFLGTQLGSITAVALVCVLIGFAFLSYTVYRQPHNPIVGLAVSLIFLTVGYSLWGFFVVTETFLVVGIVPTFPLFVLAFIYPAKQAREGAQWRIYKFVGLVTFLFLGLMLLFWPTYGGSQWASRYLLPVFPLFSWLALYVYASYSEAWAESVNKRKWWRTTAVGLFMLSVTLQVATVASLYGYKQRHQATYQMVANIPTEIILTDHKFLPSLVSVATGKNFLYIRDTAELEQLLIRLHEAGISQIGIIPVHFFAPSYPELLVPSVVNDLTLQETSPFTYQIMSTD